MPKRPSINPFYPLLVLVGVAFTVTACAYGVMAVRAGSANLATSEPAHPLLEFLNRHGQSLLLWELGILAATCLLAMSTDRFWTRGPQPAPSPPRAHDESQQP